TAHGSDPLRRAIMAPSPAHAGPGPGATRAGRNGRVSTAQTAAETALAFGTLLRRHRIAAGLTQEELAERAGISQRSISDMERGVPHRPRPDTVALLAAALDLSAPTRVAFVAAARHLGTPPLARPSAPPPSAPVFVGRARA